MQAQRQRHGSAWLCGQDDMSDTYCSSIYSMRHTWSARAYKSSFLQDVGPIVHTTFVFRNLLVSSERD